jgi:hypothetical protein
LERRDRQQRKKETENGSHEFWFNGWGGLGSKTG